MTTIKTTIMNPYDELIINRCKTTDPRFYLYHRGEKWGGKVGDCFEKNYEAFWDIYNETKNKNLKYVIANMKYHKSGNEILHAFVLDGNDMIDRSQNKRFLLPFDDFRKSQAEMTCSKVWDHKTIPRFDGIINRFGSYISIANSEMTWDKGLKKQVGSWDIAKLQVL